MVTTYSQNKTLAQSKETKQSDTNNKLITTEKGLQQTITFLWLNVRIKRAPLVYSTFLIFPQLNYFEFVLGVKAINKTKIEIISKLRSVDLNNGGRILFYK